jgi:hypothetical protein
MSVVYWLYYGLDGRKVRTRFPAGARDLYFLTPSIWLWGSPSFLSNVYGGLLPQWESGGSVKMTCDVKECVGLCLKFPIRRYGLGLHSVQEEAYHLLPILMVGGLTWTNTAVVVFSSGRIVDFRPRVAVSSQDSWGPTMNWKTQQFLSVMR